MINRLIFIATTYLLCQGPGAEELAERAFDVEKDGKVYPLKGIVSRKKQLIPLLSEQIEKLESA